MKEESVFKLALELESPWHIQSIELEEGEEGKRLHIYIGHEKGSKFKYEEEEYGVYDHQERKWRHLNFFQHECYIHANVPRVKTDSGKVKLVKVPWSRPGSSFTLLFEKDVLKLAQENMSMSGIGRRLNEHPKRMFRIIKHYVVTALLLQPLSEVKHMGLDETSRRKGHNYFTILTDREKKKVVGIGVGKDKESLEHALLDMEIRGGDRKKVKTVTLDMSKSYISGVCEQMSQAEMIFDRFHIIKQLNKHIDQIRRKEQKENVELKKSRYLWLKNNENLTEDQRQKLAYLTGAYEGLGQAYRLKESLRDVLDNAYNDKRLTPLNEWMAEAWDTNLAPLQKFVNMLANHWYGIKTFFRYKTTNAFAERVNLTIQEIKRIAKGYRSIYHFGIMIYFHLGGLNFDTHFK